MEAWNSYQRPYTNDLRMIAVVDSFSTVTNELGTVLMSRLLTTNSTTDIPHNTWPGYMAAGAFKVPFNPATNGFISLNGTYMPTTGTFFTNGPVSFDSMRGSGFPVPHWWLTLRTRARFILVDTSVNRIIDYVNLDSTEPPVDITALALTNGLCNLTYTPDGNPGSLWCTNRREASVFSPPYGVLNQIGISMGDVTPDLAGGRWNDANGIRSGTPDAMKFFRGQFIPDPSVVTSNRFYAPFEPTRTMFYETFLAGQ